MNKRYISRVAGRLILLLCGLLFVTPTLAQEATRTISDDAVNDVAHEVYCPVCESTPLDVCQTQACADWRELIREKLSQGQTRDEIFAYFAQQYGDRVLASPPKEGLNWLVWLWPIVALGVGAFVFSQYLRGLRVASGGQRTETAVSPPATHPPANDYISRIEQELKEK